MTTQHIGPIGRTRSQSSGLVSHLRRTEFDRDRDFIVAKSLTLHGDKLTIGAPFDKTLVSTRRLRQLYDSRFLAMGPQDPAETPAFDATKMSDEQLTLFLEDNGIIPRFGASRTWLLRKVNEFLKDAGVVAGAHSGAGAADSPSHPAPTKRRSKKG